MLCSTRVIFSFIEFSKHLRKLVLVKIVVVSRQLQMLVITLSSKESCPKLDVAQNKMHKVIRIFIRWPIT